MVKKPITVKLKETDISILKGLGGNTKGIETLIEHYIENKLDTDDNNPEEVFFRSIYLPIEKNMKATYVVFLNRCIKKCIRSEAIGYAIPTIIGTTGFDDQTVRKHFKKLVSVGFIKSVKGSMFRPTIRVLDGTSLEHFSQILEEYAAFIRGEKEYTDFWGEDDESG